MIGASVMKELNNRVICLCFWQFITNKRRFYLQDWIILFFIIFLLKYFIPCNVFRFLLFLPQQDFVKRATKSYFMYYLRVLIILFSTGLYRSAFSTCSFGKTRFSSFCVLGFRVSVYLAFNFYKEV